jgi:hypothetical protein
LIASAFNSNYLQTSAIGVWGKVLTTTLVSLITGISIAAVKSVA